MSIQIQRRRDANAVIMATVLADGEIGINTTTGRIHVGNGITPGGIIHARLDELPEPSAGFTNRILNGDMAIDQAREGATVYPASGTTAQTLDGWRCAAFGGGALSVQRVANSVLTGITESFAFCQHAIVTTIDASIAAGDVYLLQQVLLPDEVSDFGFGTSLARTATLSAWVKSNLTGTYYARFSAADSTRSYVFAFTIPVANTWTRITKTIPGDTTGTWTSGLQLSISLGSGTTFHAPGLDAWQAGNYTAIAGGANFMGTISNSFTLTGVQIELGSVANDYAPVPPGVAMDRAFRRYQKSYGEGVAVATASDGGALRYAPWAVATTDWLTLYLRRKMRAAPTVTIYSPATGFSGVVRNTGTSADVAATAANVSNAAFDLNHAAATAFQGYRAHWVADARP